MEKSKKKSFKIIKIILLFFAVVIIAGGIFVKLDTTAAADFTDNVLRPVIGNKAVLALEKTFFNLSDSLDKASKKSPVVPQFNDKTSTTTIEPTPPKVNLDLSLIPTDNSFSPLRDEGIWRTLPLQAFPDQIIMADTFTRPDITRPYAVVTVVQADMTKLSIGSVAGIKQPGGPAGKPGPGIVPTDIVNSGKLIAAFNGGFQYSDGHFGMIVGDTTYLPLLKNLGTVVGYTDGTFNIINYTGQPLGDNVAFVRQNCPILINDGVISAVTSKNDIFYGLPAGDGINFYTWRSGLGITKSGNLLFAVGNNLTATTLANALKSAGAVNAIQLDINPTWVRFNIFTYLNDGKYSSIPLTNELTDGSKSYLNGYQKDFFYLYQR